jgi:hypothetical protein
MKNVIPINLYNGEGSLTSNEFPEYCPPEGYQDSRDTEAAILKAMYTTGNPDFVLRVSGVQYPAYKPSDPLS